MNWKVSHVFTAISLTTLFTISCTKTAVTQEENRFDREISNEYYRHALTASDEGDISRAMELLSQALDRDPENGPARRERNRIIDGLESDSFYVKEEISRGTGLGNPLSFVLTYRDGDGVKPVSGMPVRFAFIRGEGVLTDRDITNDEGIARCYVERILDFQKSVIIQASVPVSDEKGESIDKLTRVYTFGLLSPLELPQRIFVHFRNIPFARPQRIETLLAELSTTFERMGYSDVRTRYMEEPIIFERAFGGDIETLDMLAGQTTEGTIVLLRVGEPQTTEQSSDFHRSVLPLYVRFLEPGSGKPVFETEVEGRGAGATGDEAEDRAFQRGVEAILEQVDTHLSDVRRKHGL